MGDEQERRHALAQGRKNLPQGQRIERGQALIQDQDVGPLQQGARESVAALADAV